MMLYNSNSIPSSPFFDAIKSNPKGFVVANMSTNQVAYNPKNGDPVPDTIREQNIDDFLSSFLKLEGIKRTTCKLDEDSGVVVIGGLDYDDQEYTLLKESLELVNLSHKNHIISSIVGIAPPTPIQEKKPEISEQPLPLAKTHSPIFNPDDSLKEKTSRDYDNQKIRDSSQNIKQRKTIPLGVGIPVIAVLLTAVIFVVVLPGFDFISGDLMKAAELYSNGKYDESLREYRSITKNNPNNIAALNGEGNSLVNLEQYEEALTVFDKILVIDPWYQASQIGKFKTLVAMENYFEANNYLESLSEDIPSFIVSQQKRIGLLLHYDSMLQNDPENTIALNGIGDIYDQMGLYTKARNFFDQALTIEPKNTNANNGKCNVLFHLYQFESAELCYDNTLSIDPNNISALVGKGNVLVMKKDYGEALEIFEMTYSINPNQFNPLLGWANTLVALGKYSEAKEKVDEILNKDQDNSIAMLVISNIHSERAEYNKALEIHNQILDDDPWNATVLIAKGDVLIKMKNYEEALITFDRVLSFEPSNQIAIQGLIETRQLLGYS